MTALDDPAVLDALDAALVGRRREIELLVAALAADRHVLLEGPPGTGKSTMLREVAEASGTGFVFVEGNAELTPARLAGQFDPSRVLEEGYATDVFVDGPLVEALRAGSLLYVEELNRVPEETVNLLISVMSEGELHLPRIGRIPAAPGFRLVAAMNPFDNVGTARVSSAVYDRMCRIAMGYQARDDESGIVERRTDATDERLRRRAVLITRATRNHGDVRVGSSVRGAIDLVEVAVRLARIRDLPVTDAELGLDAALVALSGRIRLHEGGDTQAEDVIRELWAQVLATEVQHDPDDEGKAPAP
ncbi:MAG: MoxR family ATPase [Acidimicrobiales bacterium]|nr:MoxR family ATPase [Acidimicrobiales bacterium]